MNLLEETFARGTFARGTFARGILRGGLFRGGLKRGFTVQTLYSSNFFSFVVIPWIIMIP